tara:strand:+ start:26 stop:157 length:132 start_codon:yes stop_codon:yes gene_type:complete
MILLPQIVDIARENKIARAALKDMKPKRLAPARLYSLSKYSNR